MHNNLGSNEVAGSRHVEALIYTVCEFATRISLPRSASGKEMKMKSYTGMLLAFWLLFSGCVPTESRSEHFPVLPAADSAATRSADNAGYQEQDSGGYRYRYGTQVTRRYPSSHLRGSVTGRPCPYDCERLGKSIKECRDWRAGNECFVQLFPPIGPDLFDGSYEEPLLVHPFD